MYKGNISIKYVISKWRYLLVLCEDCQERMWFLTWKAGEKLSRSPSEILITKAIMKQRIFHLKCPRFLSSELLSTWNTMLPCYHLLPFTIFSIVIIFICFSHLLRENAMENRNPILFPCRIPIGPGGLEHKRYSNSGFGLLCSSHLTHQETHICC